MKELIKYIKLQDKIQQIFNDYIIYKQTFTSPESFGVNGGLYDGEYIITDDENVPILGILYKINFNAINLLFFRYITLTDIRYGADKTIGFFDEQTLQDVLLQAKSDVEGLMK